MGADRTALRFSEKVTPARGEVRRFKCFSGEVPVNAMFRTSRISCCTNARRSLYSLVRGAGGTRARSAIGVGPGAGVGIAAERGWSRGEGCTHTARPIGHDAIGSSRSAIESGRTSSSKTLLRPKCICWFTHFVFFYAYTPSISPVFSASPSSDRF